MKGVRFGIKLSGGGVSTKTVDSMLLLQLAEACMRLTSKVAEAEGLGLTFHGLSIEGGSAAVASMPSDPGSARVAVAKSIRIVRGEESAPRGAEGAVDDVRATLRALPPTMTASFNVGAWSRPLRVRPMEKLEDGPWERTELRARAVRIGGLGEPRATLVSESEARPFTVSVSIDDARVLGAALYQDIDVELEVWRGADDNIKDGRVLSVTRLSDAEPASAWRAWFAQNAGDWADVEDVGEALGRHN